MGGNIMKSSYKKICVAVIAAVALGGTFTSEAENGLEIKKNMEVDHVTDFGQVHYDMNSKDIHNTSPVLKITNPNGQALDFNVFKSAVTGYKTGKYILVETETKKLNVSNYKGVGPIRGNVEDSYEYSIRIDSKKKPAEATQVIYEGFQFKNATVSVKDDKDRVYGGYSELGNSVVNNVLTLEGGSHQYAFGATTTFYKDNLTELRDQKDSRGNSLIIKSGTVEHDVFGGATSATDGTAIANKVIFEDGMVKRNVYGGKVNTTTIGKVMETVSENRVIMTGGWVGRNIYGGYANESGAANRNTVVVKAEKKLTVLEDIIAGHSDRGDASENVVNLSDVKAGRDVIGGESIINKSAKTDNNIIHLRNVQVDRYIIGGSTENSQGNTLIVHSSSKGSSVAEDVKGIQKMHFIIEDEGANENTPMLQLGVTEKNLTGIEMGVTVKGAGKILNVGEKINLLQIKKGGQGLTTEDAIENKLADGKQGVSATYQFDIHEDAKDNTKLVATVIERVIRKETKSFTETRVALADLVNQSGDALVSQGVLAAQQALMADHEKTGYKVWATSGATSMKVKSGSHVDVKGWNIDLGFAGETSTTFGTLLYSPFVEYGRGKYDSYVDGERGTEVHGDGTVKHVGLGMIMRLNTQGGLWYEGSLRGGKTDSDYQGVISQQSVSYDGNGRYFGAHVGVGKDVAIGEGKRMTPYVRYFYSRHNAMDTTLTSGEKYEFSEVESSRLRFGARYTENGRGNHVLYVGVAGEYEMKGEATSNYQIADVTAPSLKGYSAMMEVGYGLTAQDQGISYDLNLSGWLGRRKGIVASANVKWRL